MDSPENYLRAVRFERPEWIPMVFYISPACWHHYEVFSDGVVSRSPW